MRVYVENLDDINHINNDSLMLNIILLSFPLVWFIGNWLTVIFGLNINTNLEISDNSLIENIWFLWVLLSPLSVIFGLIFTAKKKYWLWFAVYMFIGVGFFLSLFVLNLYWSL